MQKSTLLKCLSTGRNLLEANAAFFVKKVDPVRKQKGKTLQHYFKGVDRDASGNAVIEFAVPSQRDSAKTYRCFIDIIPSGTNLFNLAKTTSKLGDRIKILKEADVKCFCSCPDFNWSGMKYNMKHVHGSLSENHHADDANDDHGEDINPKIRDPKHRNTLCKHLVAALSGVLTNAPTIMKRVREMPPETPKKPSMPPADKPNPVIGKAPAEQKADEVKDQIEQTPDTIKEEAIDSFDQTSAVKTEETQQALDALANNIEPGSTPTEYAQENPGVGIIGKGDEEDELEMFDIPVDNEEDEISVDDEMIITEPSESMEPLELPKP